MSPAETLLAEARRIEMHAAWCAIRLGDASFARGRVSGFRHAARMLRRSAANLDADLGAFDHVGVGT